MRVFPLGGVNVLSTVLVVTGKVPFHSMFAVYCLLLFDSKCLFIIPISQFGKLIHNLLHRHQILYFVFLPL